MNAVQEQHIPLESGFYTLREASRLLRRNVNALSRWIREESKKEPVVASDFERMGNLYVISFLDLMELRFVSYFRKAGVSLQVLRAAAKILREESKQRHPFIIKGSKFFTDGHNIFLQAAEELSDYKTINILKKQYEMFDIIKPSLLDGVCFDPDTNLPNKWHPDKRNYPNIFVSPYHAFGQPVVNGIVPTAAIMRNFEAGDTTDRLADWFDLPVESVEEAIRFELESREDLR